MPAYNGLEEIYQRDGLVAEICQILREKVSLDDKTRAIISDIVGCLLYYKGYRRVAEEQKVTVSSTGCTREIRKG